MNSTTYHKPEQVRRLRDRFLAIPKTEGTTVSASNVSIIIRHPCGCLLAEHALGRRPGTATPYGPHQKAFVELCPEHALTDGEIDA